MSEQKRIVAVCGSPRVGGNSERLTEELLRGASEAGCTTELVRLADLSINPCDACNACLEGEECTQEDDMAALASSLDAADAWIITTPVYWWGPTAQMKAFVDRWYGLNEARFEGKKVVLIVTLGDDDISAARHTVGMLTDALDYRKTLLVDTIVAPHMMNIGDADADPAMLRRVFQTGKVLAADLNS
jgi:multimeric flavodoxin WrbA